MEGTVLSFRIDRGFGWLVDETPNSPTNGTSLFCHVNNVVGRKILKPGQKVTFDLIPTPALKHQGDMIAGNIVPIVEGQS
jgi:cold shock CspA family protein